jgi:hypothetical protein
MTDPYGPHEMNHHFDRRFNDLEKRMDERFDAAEKATLVAMAAAEKAVLKAEGLADIRANEQDQLAQERNHLSARMLTRDEYSLAHGALVEKIDVLTARVERAEGAGEGAARAVSYAFLTAAFVFGLGGLIFGLIELFTR